ncbi:hypothetical protein ACH50O_16330 [Methylomonas sp. 2BW1-5-20]|uniref:hypothetical protein n=1 Tax=Methylomonas sp. 2BW1-5-20 TaxID=3376686 RepID=UPI00404E903B
MSFIKAIGFLRRQQESQALKGALKRIHAAEDSSQTLKNKLKILWHNAPLKTKTEIWTVIAFVLVAP